MKMKLMASLALVMAGGTSAHTHTDPAAPEGKIVNIDSYDYDFEKEKVDSGSGIPSDRNLLITYTSFTSLGAGQCLDGNGNQYDTIDYWGSSVWPVGSSPVDACREKCINCPGQDYELRGFSYSFRTGSFLCSCHMEDVASFDALTCSSDPYQFYSIRASLEGTGKVCSTTGTESSYECWSVNSALECPSDEPSDMPSTSPSNQQSELPSTSPSNQPSDVPSNAPSDVPSSLPSQTPSESAQPSSEPSSQPSNQPSDRPSSEPSYKPLSTPSCSPSASPTEAPSTKFGVNLFYPEWTAGVSGCR